MILKVSSGTDATKLANCIVSNYMKDPGQSVCLRAIGAGPVNQAIKATIIANKYFSKKALFISLVPSFNDLELNVTAIELAIKLIKP